MPDPPDLRDAPPAQRAEGDLPASLVPRWLALLVLIALLSAAAFSVYALLTAGPPAQPAPDAASRGAPGAALR